MKLIFRKETSYIGFSSLKKYIEIRFVIDEKVILTKAIQFNCFILRRLH